jgi:hypothetical protein
LIRNLDETMGQFSGPLGHFTLLYRYFGRCDIFSYVTNRSS